METAVSTAPVDNILRWARASDAQSQWPVECLSMPRHKDPSLADSTRNLPATSNNRHLYTPEGAYWRQILSSRTKSYISESIVSPINMHLAFPPPPRSVNPEKGFKSSARPHSQDTKASVRSSSAGQANGSRALRSIKKLFHRGQSS